MQEDLINTQSEGVEVPICIEEENDVIKGINATIEVGQTITGEAGTNASVENVGTDTHAILDFTIPRGDKGERGERGEKGETGDSATIQMNATATTLSAGSQATATITNSGDSHNANYTLALGIPQGVKGDRGERGVQGERGERGEQGIQGIQGIQGETGEAFSIYKTYPSVAAMNADASNVPEGKFTLIASNVDDPDNSKLFVKNGEGTFTYLTDMSGAQGIQGEQGIQGVQGIQGIQGIQGERGLTGSVKSQYVAELPASGDEDTFYITDKDLESHAESGEYINFETTQTAAAIQSAQIDGNATQTTYSGKNLWGGLPQSFIYNSGGVSGYTNNADGTITIPAGTTTATSYSCDRSRAQQEGFYINLQAGTYSVSGGTGTIGLQCIDISTGLNLGTSFTITEPADVVIRTRISSGETISATTIMPMVEQSATPTSYEPFVGGTPAPNPSYPQPISVVTGENTVKVLGKNLLNLNDTFERVYPPTLTYTQESNSVEITANVTIGAQYARYTVEVPDASQNYYLSCKAKKIVKGTDGTPRISVQTYGSNDNADWTNLSTTGMVITDPTEGVEYNLGRTLTGYKYYRIGFYNNLGTPVTLGEKTAYYDIQLELGSTATSYQAYTEQEFPIDLGSTELAKIPDTDYRDKILYDKTQSKWYVEKQVGKVVFDGTENWTAGTGGTLRLFYGAQYSDVLSSDQRQDFLSNNFHFIASGNETGAGFIYQQRFYFYYGDMDTDANAFKSWLASNPTTVYYALATPTTTEITNQSLIDQLEALASASLNQGVNNIFTEIETGNAMPTLELNWVEWQKYNKHNVYIWNDAINDWQIIIGMEGES